jgi:predicted anti-sigma-YlaC factor YlaD
LGTLLDCKEATRLISRALDGPLPLGRRMRLSLHLLWCDACRRFERQAAFLRLVLQRYRE